MIKLLTIVGARPQIIKAAALSRAIRNKFADRIREVIVHTGQHYDDNLSGVFFEELQMPKPDYNLKIGSGSHGVQTAKMIIGIENVIVEEKPDFIILYGDTNSTLAGAIAASKINTPVVHIEAGLRSFNKSMPEEINRIMCDHSSTYLFVPTEAGRKNLEKEGIKHNSPPFTIDTPAVCNFGDIMFDNSLFYSSISDSKSDILSELDIAGSKYLLGTFHRDYNTDNVDSVLGIVRAFNKITVDYSIKLIFPVHPRTRKVLKSLEENEDVRIFNKNKYVKQIEPVSFFDIIQLEKNAELILTDSGGVQKEAYFFNKPCVILRTETEWVEIPDSGFAVITGSDEHKIIDAFQQLINLRTTQFPRLFGSGNTAELICLELLKS